MSVLRSTALAVLLAFVVAMSLSACGSLPPSLSPGGREKSKVLDVKTKQGVETMRDTERELRVTPASVEGNPNFQVIDSVALPYFPAYRVGASDVLEVVYHIKYEKTNEPYRLEVQDRLGITFPYNPQFSTTTLVRTDGRISLPLVGEMQVVGMTVDEVTRDINKRYSRYINNPSASVTLEEFNVKIEELKKAITTAPRGQSKVAPVAPDGRIAFPIIGNIQAAGYTVAQLEEVINKKYAEYVRNLQVTLVLLEIHHNRLYVFGEVNQPGIYEMQGPYSLLQALTQAGGFRNTANLQDVLVFRNSGVTQPVVFRVDLENMLKNGHLYGDFIMQPADVLYVPKSPLDDLNDLIAKVFTRGIYAVIPFQSSFNLTYDLTPQNANRTTTTTVTP